MKIKSSKSGTEIPNWFYIKSKRWICERWITGIHHATIALKCVFYLLDKTIMFEDRSFTLYNVLHNQDICYYFCFSNSLESPPQTALSACTLQFVLDCFDCTFLSKNEWFNQPPRSVVPPGKIKSVFVLKKLTAIPNSGTVSVFGAPAMYFWYRMPCFCVCVCGIDGCTIICLNWSTIGMLHFVQPILHIKDWVNVHINNSSNSKQHWNISALSLEEHVCTG